MLLNPERIFGWSTGTYILMLVVAVAAFFIGFIRKKRKYADLCVVLIFLLLLVLCEIILSFRLGGTEFFILEWLAYFGELLVVLPVFVGYLLGALAKPIFTKRKSKTPFA